MKGGAQWFACHILYDMFDAAISGNRCPPAVLEKAKGRRHSYLAFPGGV